VSVDHSGPAFPSGIQPTGYASEGSAFEYGMTLRDYFAGQALAGVWAGRESDFVKISAPTTTDVAIACYAIADAMIAARSGHGRPTGEA
jgi:hypothetical protein